MAVPPYLTARVDVLRIPDGETDDVVAVEEPLEIRIGGRPVAVTMRTPGHDEELALGFALSEGLRATDARLPDDLAANTIELDAPGFDADRLVRSFYTSSSCGVCGKGALEAVSVETERVTGDLRLPARLIAGLPDALRVEQPVQCVDAVDRRLVDAHQNVARLDARRFRRAAIRDLDHAHGLLDR